MEKKTGKTYFCPKCKVYPDKIVSVYSTSKITGEWSKLTNTYYEMDKTQPTLVKTICKKCGAKLELR